MKPLEEMIAAAEQAVALLCKTSCRRFDDYDRTAARLGNAADALMSAVGGEAADEYWARMLKGLNDKIAAAKTEAKQ